MAGILIYVVLWMALSVGISWLLNRWGAALVGKRRSGT